MACAACDHEKSSHLDNKGPCDCGCTGYFVKGSDRCLNPSCGNCNAIAEHRANHAGLADLGASR